MTSTTDRCVACGFAVRDHLRDHRLVSCLQLLDEHRHQQPDAYPDAPVQAIRDRIAAALDSRSL